MSVRLVYTFFRDLFAVLPSGPNSDWVDAQELRSDRPTVILVTGFAATRRTVSAMRKRFLRDNCNVLVLALDWTKLEDGLRGLRQMVAEISRLCVQLRKDRRTSSQPIYLVSHSAGGLAVRYYTQRLGGDAYIDRVVTVGTPHRGTWIAGLGLFTHLVLKFGCLWHMLPWSKFLREINTAAWPQGVPWLTIGSTGDYLCPPRTTKPPEVLAADVSVQSVLLHDLSHSDYLLSKTVYEEVARFLNLRTMSKISSSLVTTPALDGA